MTGPADDAQATLPPDLTITVAEHVRDPEARRAAERVVAAHVARNLAAADRERGAAAERARLVAAAGAPLRRLLDADPAAAAALRELRAFDGRRGRDGRATPRPPVAGPQPLRSDVPRVGDELTGPHPGVIPVALAVGPPYDISWSWSHPEGNPPGEHTVDPVTGTVRMRGAPGDSGFVSANGGFGVQLTLANPALRWFVQMTYSGFGVATAPAPGDSANAWAWMRYEVKRGEDETISFLLGAVFDRKATGPFGHDVEEVFPQSGFVDLTTDMQAGVEYTLLVDFHIDAQIHSDEGGASASSEAEWRVGSMGPI